MIVVILEWTSIVVVVVFIQLAAVLYLYIGDRVDESTTTTTTTKISGKNDETYNHKKEKKFLK